MKYYLIAGEASGDLHASHLMRALEAQDTDAEFRCIGGDLMQAEGGKLLRHYRNLAYMGIIPVLLHIRTILGGMKACEEDILAWQPDVVILVDYPGFNLKVAKFIKAHTSIPIFYYISPKIWAWKEHRIKAIRRDIDRVYSILPFEVDFFEGKHHYPIDYIGNPTMDEVTAFEQEHPRDFQRFIHENQLPDAPILALLAGSRKQEIADNLPRMLEAIKPLTENGEYTAVLAAAPSIDDTYYEQFLQQGNIRVVRDQTYALLQHSTAALVTSGTATLETALFRIPQVVCYYIKAGKLASWGRKLILKIPYISLVNLVANAPLVTELVAEQMNVKNCRRELLRILPGNPDRDAMLKGYERMAERLGTLGAPDKAARLMIERLRNTFHKP